MKTISKFLLFFLLANLGFSQTQIQMPSGFGLYGPNNFVPNVAKPFYSHNGFLYCTAHTAPSGFPLSLNFFKVNEATNVVTPISTNVSIDINNFLPSDFQVNEGIIYFLLSGNIYKIDPTSNSLALVTGSIGQEFVILNNKIFGSTGYIYDLVTLTGSPLMNPENPLQTMSLNTLILHNNSVFGVRTIINLTPGPNENQYTSKVYRILDANSVQLLYTNPFNGIYEGFDNQRPVIFNNKLLYRFRKILNNVATTLVDSYDLNNNTISTIYEYEPINLTNTHYINNNNIYFINSFGQTAVSNGISASSLTNFPILLNSTTFGFKIGTPSNGSGNNMTVLNNKVMF